MLDHNYFDILDLPEQFSQDINVLNEKLTQLQSTVHPDNFAQATAQEKRLMMQYSAMINEAYQVMKDPILRAIHLLELRGIVLDNDTAKDLDKAFLSYQLSLREELEEASHVESAFLAFREKIELAFQNILMDLSKLLDLKHVKNLVLAREKVLQGQFYQKLMADIEKISRSLEVDR